MSKQEKLVHRLLSVPKDFTWDELIKLLAIFGYKEFTGGKTGGSRRRFVDEQKISSHFINRIPSNITKQYAIREVIAHLKDKGYLKDE